MAKELKPEERLIVAADFEPRPQRNKDDPGASKQIEEKVLTLAKALRGTGVILKVNSALRAVGYGLIGRVQSYGVKVFADLKLIDIPNTLRIDGMLLQEVKPHLLTVMCQAGVESIQELKGELPDTEVLGVTALTHLDDTACQLIFGCTTREAVRRMADIGIAAQADGFISSPSEVEMLRAKTQLVMTFNTPAIRPAWSLVEGDDQNKDRVMTPAKAIKAGATRIVIGRPITQAPDPYAAVMRTIDEIAAAA